MKGQILDFSVQKNEGVISVPDGSRFVFSGAEWTGDTPPLRGMWVDFEAQDKNAISIYKAIGNITNAPLGEKSKAAVTLWGIFLGAIGAHKFYMGSWGWGIIYLVMFWTWIPAAVALVEWIRYILMSDDEFHGKLAEYKSRNPGPFSFFW